MLKLCWGQWHMSISVQCVWTHNASCCLCLGSSTIHPFPHPTRMPIIIEEKLFVTNRCLGLFQQTCTHTLILWLNQSKSLAFTVRLRTQPDYSNFYLSVSQKKRKKYRTKFNLKDKRKAVYLWGNTLHLFLIGISQKNEITLSVTHIPLLFQLCRNYTINTSWGHISL